MTGLAAILTQLPAQSPSDNAQVQEVRIALIQSVDSLMLSEGRGLDPSSFFEQTNLLVSLLNDRSLALLAESVTQSSTLSRLAPLESSLFKALFAHACIHLRITTASRALLFFQEDLNSSVPPSEGEVSSSSIEAVTDVDRSINHALLEIILIIGTMDETFEGQEKRKTLI